MQHGNTRTQPDAFVKRVSVRSGGAGHALSGVIKAHRQTNGAVTGTSDQRATVLRSANNVVVRLGT